MKPTFLRVGVPKNTVRPPTTVLPPTSGVPASIGSDIVEWTGNGPDPTIPFPSALQAGDLMILVSQIESANLDTLPTGWTDHGQIAATATNGGAGVVLSKDATAGDVSTGSITLDMASGEELAVVIWRIANTSDTSATVAIANENPALTGDPTPDAITVTPAAAGTYFVFTVWHANKGNFPTSQAVDGPDGYTEFAAADVADGVLSPAVYLWSNTVNITTSETPGEFNWNSSAGSRVYAHTTVAVLSSSAPSIASGDHTHTLTDDDVTDVDASTTAPVVGDILRYDGTDWVPALITRYVATAAATIANTTTETTLFGTGEGSLTLPANYLRAGRTVRITARGQLSDTGTPNFTLKAKLGSTVVTSIGPVALTTVSAVEWVADILLTCRTAGASGTVMGGGSITFDDNAVWHDLPSTSAATVDTTGTLALDLTWQWGTADAANTITSQEAVVW